MTWAPVSFGGNEAGMALNPLLPPLPPQSFPAGPLGDDDFNIPPITPPTLPDHMLPPHLPHDSAPGPYHAVDPPTSSAPPQHAFQLPALTGGQDGAFSPGSGPMASTLSVVGGAVLMMGGEILEFYGLIVRFRPPKALEKKLFPKCLFHLVVAENSFLVVFHGKERRLMMSSNRQVMGREIQVEVLAS